MAYYPLTILLCCAGGLYLIKHLVESYRAGILYQTIRRVLRFALRLAFLSVSVWLFWRWALCKCSPACELSINLTFPETLDQFSIFKAITPTSNLFPFFVVPSSSSKDVILTARLTQFSRQYILSPTLTVFFFL